MRHHFSATFHIIQSILLASEMRTFLRISCCCLASGSKWRSLQRTQPISASRSAFMFHNHTLLQCVLVGMHMHTFTVLLATIPKQCNVRITFHYRSRHYFYIARILCTQTCKMHCILHSYLHESIALSLKRKTSTMYFLFVCVCAMHIAHKHIVRHKMMEMFEE